MIDVKFPFFKWFILSHEPLMCGNDSGITVYSLNHFSFSICQRIIRIIYKMLGQSIDTTIKFTMPCNNVESFVVVLERKENNNKNMSLGKYYNQMFSSHISDDLQVTQMNASNLIIGNIIAKTNSFMINAHAHNILYLLFVGMVCVN